MRKQILLLLLLISSVASAQQFTCADLLNDIRVWNQHQQPENYLEWAKDVKANQLYHTNTTGALEYVYVMTADRDVDIDVMRELALDFLCTHFKISKHLRADIARKSPGDAILFTGNISKIGTFYSLTDENYIDTQIYFDIRFKNNRVRLKTTIENFHVIKTSDRRVLENKLVHVKDAYPLNKYSDHKDSYSRAFINANSRMMNYASKFLNFFNQNIGKKQAEEDW